MRKGFDKDHLTAVDLAKRLEDAGVAAITVHGRTRSQMYSGLADRSIIRDVKRAVSVPVIANGDIFSAEDAVSMLRYTGADMVMVGRGAFGDRLAARDEGASLAGDADMEVARCGGEVVFARARRADEPLQRRLGLGACGVVAHRHLAAVELLRLPDDLAAQRDGLEAFALRAETLVADHRELHAAGLRGNASPEFVREGGVESRPRRCVAESAVIRRLNAVRSHSRPRGGGAGRLQA